VHDVGTVIRPRDPAAHAAVGARKVRPLLGARVAWLVANHVVAKRYLVTTDAGYRAQLSAVSVRTLETQGGELDARAVARLEAHPDLDALLALRRADEGAKVPGASVPGLAAWESVLAAVCQSLAADRLKRTTTTTTLTTTGEEP